MLKGWRTILFNLFVAMVGVLAAADWAAVIPAEWVGLVLIAVASVNAALRAVTTTPLGQK